MLGFVSVGLLEGRGYGVLCTGLWGFPGGCPVLRPDDVLGVSDVMGTR